jgi:hypothetical protein
MPLGSNETPRSPTTRSMAHTSPLPMTKFQEVEVRTPSARQTPRRHNSNHSLASSLRKRPSSAAGQDSLTTSCSFELPAEQEACAAADGYGRGSPSWLSQANVLHSPPVRCAAYDEMQRSALQHTDVGLRRPCELTNSPLVFGFDDAAVDEQTPAVPTCAAPIPGIFMATSGTSGSVNVALQSAAYRSDARVDYVTAYRGSIVAHRR